MANPVPIFRDPRFIIPAADVPRLSRYHTLIRNLAEDLNAGEDLVLDHRDMSALTDEQWDELETLLMDDMQDNRNRENHYRLLFQILDEMERSQQSFATLMQVATASQTFSQAQNALILWSTANQNNMAALLDTQRRTAFRDQLDAFAQAACQQPGILASAILMRNLYTTLLAIQAPAPWIIHFDLDVIKPVLDYLGSGQQAGGARRKARKTRKVTRRRG